MTRTSRPVWEVTSWARFLAEKRAQGGYQESEYITAAREAAKEKLNGAHSRSGSGKIRKFKTAS